MPVYDHAQTLPTITPDPRLGRLIDFDIRSLDYPIRTLLGPTTVLQTKMWPCTTYLNQGQIGQCVGFGCGHEILAEPVALPCDYNLAHLIYIEAQKIDPWAGENYEGTSVLAGVTVLKTMGYLGEFRWAFGIQDVLETLSNYGPVIFGLNWYQGMMSTDTNGLIHVTGTKQGGHCILGVGYDHERQLVRLHNSWSNSWGIGGDCWISVADLTLLLGQQGEACVPTVRLNPIAPPAPTTPQFFRVYSSNYYHGKSHIKQFMTAKEAAAAGYIPHSGCT